MNLWSVLPDELWRRIMEIGIEAKSLDHKAICRLSTTCRRLRRLAGDDSVWSLLVLHSDFPICGNDLDLSEINCDSSCSSTDNISKFKSLFKIRYEKERVLAELAEHQRKILEIMLDTSLDNDRDEKERLLFEHGRKIQEIMLHTSVEVESIMERMAGFRMLELNQAAADGLAKFALGELTASEHIATPAQDNIPGGSTIPSESTNTVVKMLESLMENMSELRSDMTLQNERLKRLEEKVEEVVKWTRPNHVEEDDNDDRVAQEYGGQDWDAAVVQPVVGDDDHLRGVQNDVEREDDGDPVGDEGDDHGRSSNVPDENKEKRLKRKSKYTQPPFTSPAYVMRARRVLSKRK
ncbi:hypothetical protein BUALT_Bualt12G0052600 [Buddleja alternifolia]|uniref:F-box domain-containing protein n=1 Tax=Buddleja alternifolia TaxID=168488 RepID=A0AAV6WVI0_9LAMI|nr:hypothetical protein BUALT_Bualt12G0052600 [Buddleja alternifolia]